MLLAFLHQSPHSYRLKHLSAFAAGRLSSAVGVQILEAAGELEEMVRRREKFISAEEKKMVFSAMNLSGDGYYGTGHWYVFLCMAHASF